MTRRLLASIHDVGPKFEFQGDQLVDATSKRFASTHVPSRYADLIA